MSKTIKPMIVILLVLSVVSLSLGTMLFSKREILKLRVQRLEASITKVAQSAGYDAFDIDELRDFKRMEKQLNELPALVQNNYEKWAEIEQTLEAKEKEVGALQVQLATAEARVGTLEPQLLALQERFDQKEIELAGASTQLNDLDKEKRGLKLNIEDLGEQLVQAEEEVKDVEGQLATLETTIARLEKDLGGQTIANTASGLTGNIIVVNSDWNFVVIDRGNLDELEPGSEALVHRDDRLIGKVRVSNVKEQMAVADIVRDWEQLPIQEGDYVLF